MLAVIASQERGANANKTEPKASSYEYDRSELSRTIAAIMAQPATVPADSYTEGYDNAGPPVASPEPLYSELRDRRTETTPEARAPEPTPRAVAQQAPVDLVALVCSYPWPCDWAIATVYCESSGNPNAIGREGPYVFVGWFQVLDGSTDPATNVAQAFVQWQQWQRGERPRPWPGCPR